MYLQRESLREAFDRRKPNLLLPAGLNLLKEVLGEIGYFRQFLLRKGMLESQFLEPLSHFVHRIHPSDRRGSTLTLLPVIAWIITHANSTEGLPISGGTSADLPFKQCPVTQGE